MIINKGDTPTSALTMTYASFLAALTALLLSTPAASAGLSKHGPVGFQVFCLTQPDHCTGGGASQLPYSEALGDTLVAVNHRINARITPRVDTGDVWSVNVRAGDCEDYALTKRAALIAAGLPASALRLGLAQTPEGEAHIVLVVRTEVNDFVLDNLTNAVLPMHRTRLHWIAMTGADGRTWSRL